jgi:hypothetical protein
VSQDAGPFVDVASCSHVRIAEFGASELAAHRDKPVPTEFWDGAGMIPAPSKPMVTHLSSTLSRDGVGMILGAMVSGLVEDSESESEWKRMFVHYSRRKIQERMKEQQSRPNHLVQGHDWVHRNDSPSSQDFRNRL